MKSNALDIAVENVHVVENHGAEFTSIVCSGAWTYIGFRTSMEDVYLCVDDFMHDYGLKNFADGPSAFYGVYAFPYNFVPLVCLFCFYDNHGACVF